MVDFPIIKWQYSSCPQDLCNRLRLANYMCISLITGKTLINSVIFIHTDFVRVIFIKLCLFLSISLVPAITQKFCTLLYYLFIKLYSTILSSFNSILNPLKVVLCPHSTHPRHICTSCLSLPSCSLLTSPEPLPVAWIPYFLFYLLLPWREGSPALVSPLLSDLL